MKLKEIFKEYKKENVKIYSVAYLMMTRKEKKKIEEMEIPLNNVIYTFPNDGAPTITLNTEKFNMALKEFAKKSEDYPQILEPMLREESEDKDDELQ